MKKLIKGLLDFQRHGFPAYRETFSRLSRGQAPDTLFISCCDSRVVPNLFASTHPGDLFVARNVGNMIPPADAAGKVPENPAEAAALEYALVALPVTEIIVCGHSGCGAMAAIEAGTCPEGAPNLARWLELGRPARERLEQGEFADLELPRQDRLAQLNVLQQLEHLRTYPSVRARLERGTLRLHGWWFDICAAQVHSWNPEIGRFVPIDEREAERLMRQLEPVSLLTAATAPEASQPAA